VIQALDGPIRFERRPVGEDGAALPWQAWRSGAQWQKQPAFRGGGAVDRPHRQPLARPAGRVWALEQRVHALPRLGEGRRLAAVVRGRLGRSGYGIRTIVKVHRHGQGAKGGLKARPSGARKAG